MIRKIFAFWDKTAEDISGSLLMVRNENEAIRVFLDLADQPDSIIGRYLKDHELHEIGHIETDTKTPVFKITGKIVLTGETIQQMKEAEKNVQA